MATATQREILDGGQTIYWNVTLDNGTKYVLAAASSPAAITAATALDTAAQLLVTNQTTIRSRAQTALTTNATYLALASPSTAQTTAQVQALTRECNGLIRLLLDLFDSTTGT
jgi:hypothetical protein